MIDSRGLTLTELAVVIVILAIACVLSIPAIGVWKRKYDVETTVKEMYNALSEARMTAFNQKRVCGLVWSGSSPNQVTLRCDTDEDGDITNAGGFENLWTKTLKLSLDENFNGTMCAFSIKGFAVDVNSQGSFFYSGADAQPEYGCVVVERSRIKMGSWESGQCTLR